MTHDHDERLRPEVIIDALLDLQARIVSDGGEVDPLASPLHDGDDADRRLPSG